MALNRCHRGVEPRCGARFEHELKEDAILAKLSDVFEEREQQEGREGGNDKGATEMLRRSMSWHIGVRMFRCR